VIQVPIKDEDGNPIGGVRLPDIAAPLGSQGGGHNSFLGSVCSLVGITCSGKKDQARTRCHESISRRYHDRNGNINTVRIAARELVNARLLLPEDLTIIVHSAAQAPGP
jgi:hypothetical protein